MAKQYIIGVDTRTVKFVFESPRKFRIAVVEMSSIIEGGIPCDDDGNQYKYIGIVMDDTAVGNYDASDAKYIILE
jgi:hypothetical protein